MANNFNWVEVRTRDLEKARSFYENLFRWKISGKKNEDFAYWHIDTGEKPEGGMWRMPQDKPLGILVYIAVEDIDATLEKVEELGGKVTLPKSPAGNSFRAEFEDPDGNTFGLWQEPKKSD
ncbi:MAG: VOC family protein [Thermoplasmata archaeon]